MAVNKKLPILGGVILGATFGVATAFLFGTDEGKKLRKDLRKQLPGVFNAFDDMAQSSKDRLQELPGTLLDDIKLMISEAANPTTNKSTDVQEGKILPPTTETTPLKRARVMKAKKQPKS